MKKITVVILLMLILLPMSVGAIDITPPTAPDSAEGYMPEDTQSFAEGVWYILSKAVKDLLPEIYETAGLCLSVFAIMLLTAVVQSISDSSQKVAHLASTILLGIVLIDPANALIRLGIDAITEMSGYGNLLIPVLTGALAAQGSVSTSAALYAITTFFGSLLA